MNSSYDLRSQQDESEILAEFLPKLIRLAERNISPKLRPKFDGDDIGATVMRTVVRRAREGKIKIEKSDDFWRLIITITLNKVRKKSQYWKAQIRNVDREAPVAADGPKLDELAIDPATICGDPTDAQAEEWNDTLVQLADLLDEKCMTVLNGRLAGLSTYEIAEQIDVTPRSVRRYLEKVESELLKLNRANYLA